ncbi:GNAT family N-acetyltransferase [Paenisporosarcina sp. NPDC076898]|uniref:GNAT family N-acetyltransferase n=1 Tax=unclassified Paenisporosarcina TaxID=2642018 RepID=UPI003CFF59DB
MIVHESERLKLKVFSLEDEEASTSFWGDAEVMFHCGGITPHEMLGKVLMSYQACHERMGLSVYGVVEKESGLVIGAAGFNIANGLEKVELIYHFSKSSWGKGYATEAAISCIELAKQTIGVQRIFASADPKNNSSTKILKKAGFQYMGMKWFNDTNQEEPYFEYQIL